MAARILKLFAALLIMFKHPIIIFITIIFRSVFLDLYLIKFLDTSAKLFLLCVGVTNIPFNININTQFVYKRLNYSPLLKYIENFENIA